MTIPNIQWVNVAFKAITDVNPDFFNQLVDPNSDRLSLLAPHLGETENNQESLAFFDQNLKSALVDARQNQRGLVESVWLDLLGPHRCCSTCTTESAMGLTEGESLVLQRALLRAHIRQITGAASATPSRFSVIEEQIESILQHTRDAPLPQ